MISNLRRADTDGFSLVELMVVVAIIGILAMVAIPNFIAYRNKAYCSSAESDLKSIMAAVASYFSEPNNTTITKASLGITSAQLSNSNDYTISTDTTTNTITVVVTDASGRCPRFNTIEDTLVK